MSKKIIINADDLGMSKGINTGIDEAFQNGILTSCTMVVNMDSSEEAIPIALKHPNLGVGLHLNLTCGRPVSLPRLIPSLVNSEGFFYSLPLFLFRIMSKRIAVSHIAIEIEAQIRRIKQFGIKVTHIDSHQHIHMLPVICKILAHMARENNIFWIRYPLQNHTIIKNFIQNQNLKRLFVGYFCKFSRYILIKEGISFTEQFYGISEMAVEDKFEVFKKTLLVSHGLTEIMCHPGYVDDELAEIDHYLIEREKELKALTNPELKQIVKKHKICLVNYQNS